MTPNPVALGALCLAIRATLAKCTECGKVFPLADAVIINGFDFCATHGAGYAAVLHRKGDVKYGSDGLMLPVTAGSDKPQ